MKKNILLLTLLLFAFNHSRAQFNWIYSNNFSAVHNYNYYYCDTNLFRMVNDTLQIGFYFPIVAQSCPTEFKYTPLSNDSMRVRFSWVQNPTCALDEPSMCVILKLFPCDSFNTMKLWLNNSLDYSDSLNGTWYHIIKNPNCTITAGIAVGIRELRWELTSTLLNNEIRWNTTDEINVSHFEIQKSYDGIIFEALATLNSEGNGSHAYYVLDSRLQVHHFYRIKTIDKDGKSTFTATKSVKPTTEHEAILVYPNPVKTFYNIHFSGMQESEVQLTLHDIAGRIVDLNTIKINTKDFIFQRNLHEFPKGFYILQLRNAENEIMHCNPLLIE